MHYIAVYVNVSGGSRNFGKKKWMRTKGNVLASRTLSQMHTMNYRVYAFYTGKGDIPKKNLRPIGGGATLRIRHWSMPCILVVKKYVETVNGK